MSTSSSLASIIGQLYAVHRRVSSTSSPEKKTDANITHFENVLESMRTRLRSLQSENKEFGDDIESSVTLQSPSESNARLAKSLKDAESGDNKENADGGDGAERTSTLYDDLYADLTNLPDLEGNEGEFDFDLEGSYANYDKTTLMDALAQLDGIADPEDPLVREYYVVENRNEAGLRRGKKQPNLRMGGGSQFQMEDANMVAYPFDNNAHQGLFCVFDGFAGPECSRDATKALPKVLSAELARRGGSEKMRDLKDMLPAVFAAADAELIKHEDLGCTATMAFVWQHEDGTRYLQAANVGDSSIYLCRGGKAIMLAVEHKASSPAEHERVAAMGIDISPGATRINGVAVARAFGAHFIKSKNLGIISEPYVSPVYELGTDDKFIIIASDGVWDIVSGQEACDLVKDDPGAAEMASHLVRYVISNRKCTDNVTAVVVCF